MAYHGKSHLLPGYKRARDLFISTTPFEINSTRKVIRAKVVERYHREATK